MERRILSTGHNAAALRLRNAALQEAGYEVTTTKETGLLLDLVFMHDFEAVVLCGSIPASLRESLARELKRLKPRQSIIVICADQDEQKLFESLADESVIAAEEASGPLIEAANRIADKRKNRTATL